MLIDVAASLTPPTSPFSGHAIDESLAQWRALGATLPERFVEVGSAVQNCAVGDVVVTAPPGSCDCCHPCLTGMDNYYINPARKTRLVPWYQP